jgi:hypothetical protein
VQVIDDEGRLREARALPEPPVTFVQSLGLALRL